MKKLVLIVSSFFLITTIFGQEKQSEKIQQLKENERSVQIKNVEAPNQVSSKATNSNQPVSYYVGRDGVQRVVKAERTIEDFSTETIKTVKKQLKELYGEHYSEYGEPNIVFYAQIYERCEFIPLSDAPSGVKNISSLNVKDKYNPEKIFHDNLNEFSVENFNVLKYSFDYYNTTDTYYRIYATDTVVNIKGLK